MRVQEVDARTASDEVLAAFAEIEHACAHELQPGEPLRPAWEVIAFLRHQPASLEAYHWLADGGFGGLYVHGPAAAFLHLVVDPARRREGIGTALLDAARARCRELGVSRLGVEYATEPGAAFARSAGTDDGPREVRLLLDLRAAELPEPAPPPCWRLVTWLARVPDEHLAAYVRARAAMDDAPLPEGMELPADSVERVRAAEAALVARDREMRLTVAIDGDGEIGSFTELRVTRGSVLGFTDDTGTVVAHRGQGLARAVKLESLRRLRDDHPQIEVVTTLNAEANAPMRRVNERIGFQVVSTITMATLAV